MTKLNAFEIECRKLVSPVYNAQPYLSNDINSELTKSTKQLNKCLGEWIENKKISFFLNFLPLFFFYLYREPQQRKLAIIYSLDLHNRRFLRLRSHDYARACAYFVTICCQDRINYFGEIVNKEMVFNEYGDVAYKEWKKLPVRYPGIS
ncbi:MAG: hypothetical protein LBQ87_00970, partial [Candidatus Fibromonas sp.]|nr:hypothetical protein [Candidatus Fibromonas sp.]